MRAISLVLALVLVSAVSRTDEPDVGSSTTVWNPIERVRTDPWRFHVDLYGWLPEAPATINVGSNAVNLPEELDTILESLRFTVMAHCEVHKGPIGAFVSPVFYKGEYDDDVRSLGGSKVELTVKDDRTNTGDRQA